MKIKSFFNYKSVLVPANGVAIKVPIGGSFCRCLSATARCEIAIQEATEFFPWDSGLYFELDSSDPEFSVLWLRNNTAAPVTVQLLTSRGKSGDNRLNVISTQTVPVQNQDAPTILTQASATLGVTTQSAVFTGTPNLVGRTRRKMFIVTNRDAALELEWRIANGGGAAGAVQPKSSIALPTDQDLYLYNPGGSGVAYNVTEIFYTS